MSAPDAEAVLTSLGSLGRWHVTIFIVLTISINWPYAWHLFIYVFMVAEPVYYCKSNYTKEQIIPRVHDPDGSFKYDKCRMYASNTSNETQPCNNGWTYESDFDYSIVTEWDLVCDRAFLDPLSYTIFSIGLVIGAFLFPVLADIYGRKIVFITAQIGTAVVGILEAVILPYEAHLPFQFFRGVLVQGIFLPGVIMVSEMFPARMRVIAGIGSQVQMSVGMMVLSLLGFLLRDWRYLLLCISALGFLAIGLHWVLPESVAWLISKNKWEQVKRIIIDAAKLNKVQLPAKMWMHVEEEKNVEDIKKITENGCAEDDGEESFLNLFRFPKMRKYTITLLVYWTFSPVVYYGITLGTEGLAGDLYLNFFLMGLMEFPSVIICLFALPRLGRKLPLFSLHMLAGASCLCYTLIPAIDRTNDTSAIVTAMALITKMAISGCFLISLFYTPEVFPTSCRNSGTGLCAMIGYIMNILVPYILDLRLSVGWLPGLIMSILAFLAGFLVIFLPETHERPLPVTVREVEAWEPINLLQLWREGFSCSKRSGESEANIKGQVNEAFSEERKIEEGPSLNGERYNNKQSNGSEAQVTQTDVVSPNDVTFKS